MLLVTSLKQHNNTTMDARDWINAGILALIVILIYQNVRMDREGNAPIDSIVRVMYDPTPLYLKLRHSLSLPFKERISLESMASKLGLVSMKSIGPFDKCEFCHDDFHYKDCKHAVALEKM